ncbi:MAG: Uma2 family endonuclease [Leptospiraceae bacterium]|nr:Uma2 family endonuclease [Leptospiraceae bacterium]MCP5493553.1 Uma2 family endonuclease [Leptospiraceae bacterium]
MLTSKEKKIFNIEEAEIEDGKPVDNIFSEKQMRLLTEPLYTSWESERYTNFLATANVGIFTEILENAIVPDVLLSLEVEKPENRTKKEDLCYYLDKIGKAPEVVIEIVSNKDGNELDSKLKDYGKIGVLYYAIYDPGFHILKGKPMSSYRYIKGMAVGMEKSWFEEVGLGLRLWEGFFEDEYGVWLRWCDYFGKVISTGKELSIQEKKRAEKEKDGFIQRAIERGKLTLKEIAEDFGVSEDYVKSIVKKHL